MQAYNLHVCMTVFLEDVLAGFAAVDLADVINRTFLTLSLPKKMCSELRSFVNREVGQGSHSLPPPHSLLSLINHVVSVCVKHHERRKKHLCC